jgi:hypothetical protein
MIAPVASPRPHCGPAAGSQPGRGDLDFAPVPGIDLIAYSFDLSREDA